MIGRWLATLCIAALFALNTILPATSIGRRGTEAAARADIASAALQVGDPVPDLALPDLSGNIVRLADLRGHRLLLTFERSVDW